MIHIDIETANAAFDGPQRSAEVARILRLLAELVDQGHEELLDQATLSDINGNTVGQYRKVPEDELSEFERASISYWLGFVDGTGYSIHHIRSLGDLRNRVLAGTDPITRIADEAQALYEEHGADPLRWSRANPQAKIASVPPLEEVSP